MVGVIVNVVAVIIGGTIGLLLKKGLNEKVKKVVLQGVGLCVIIIGISNALQTNDMLLLVLSLVTGGVIGALLRIEDRLDGLGLSIEQRFASKEGGFAKGFVWASLIYCVGAMAIVGSIEAGINGDNTTLYVKSILDGVTAIVFTATMGYGVIFSSVTIFIYQGAIVLLGYQLQPIITDQIVTEMSAVGGILILGIGLNILEIKKIHIGDMLPAVLIPAIWILVTGLF